MGMNSKKEPKIHIFSILIEKDTDKCLYFHVVEYDNGLFVTLYDNLPRLGSMTLAYPLGNNVEIHSIFIGKSNQFADAIAMIISKHTNKLVYGSINVSDESQISLNLIKSLIDQYFDTI